MKFLTNSFLTFCLISLISSVQIKAQNSKIDQFFGNGHFLFEEINETIVVSMEKAPWEAFTFSLENEDFINNPICRIQVKAVEDIDIRIDLSDGNEIFEGAGTFSQKIKGDGEFHEYVFDFSAALPGFDVTSQPYLILYVNPGQTYTGEIMVKNIDFTVTEQIENTPKQTEILPELLVYPNPVVDIVNVELPESFSGQIIVRDVAGRQVYESFADDSFGNSAQADLANLLAGTYFISLVNQDITLSSRIQVN